MNRVGASLRRCRRGATIVEFALLAPVFLAMMLGLIEIARLIWTRQTLEEVAFETARCMSVGTTCATADARRGFAVERAHAMGLTLSPAGVVPVAATTCNGAKGANRVVLRLAFVSAARGLVPLPRTIRAAACFPVLS